MEGAWLETLGFEPGTPIRVECDGGRLVITRADEVIVE
ncbi:type I addiction module toxin, SymE family [Clostridium sp. TM06-18]|nr:MULTISPECIES: SymE family type I addiction module toxin [unclassified Clostridium]RHT23299.1 type I addiction module toxin, SymE family [Clostridium sp. AM32-2]RHU32395.1 type I addiction module toxin, SymE family [Clostridium sp. TM06-18]